MMSMCVLKRSNPGAPEKRLAWWSGGGHTGVEMQGISGWWSGARLPHLLCGTKGPQHALRPQLLSGVHRSVLRVGAVGSLWSGGGARTVDGPRAP